MNKGFSEKIKVLFFISSLEGGGAEQVMVTLLSVFDRNRFEPTLLFLYPYDDSPYRDRLPADIGITVVSRKGDSALEKIRQFIAFLKAVRKNGPDVIVSMLTHNNLMALFAGLIFRIKTVAGEHILLSETLKTKEGSMMLWFRVSLLVKLLYRWAGRIIAVSRGIRDDLAENYAVSPHKITVIHNPLDMDRITTLSTVSEEHPFFQTHAPIIIGIGRLVKQKGFDVLLMAFSRVVAEQDARLLLLGEGPQKQRLQELAANLGIADKAFFAGFRKNPYALLARADIFVLSSRYEGFPMVLLEAMACGVPIVSTDCNSGPAELLEGGKYGLLVPVDDADALAERILELLNDPPMRAKLSLSEKERSRDFLVETIVKQYEHVIHELILG